jgi:hypothetical protein
MNYEIIYSHTKKENVTKHYFRIYNAVETETETVISDSFYVYTYKDLSGFDIDYGVKTPEDYILIGTILLANMDYIKETIKSL